MTIKKQGATNRLIELLSPGDLRYKAIASKLNAEGFKTQRGKKWNDANVRSWANAHKGELVLSYKPPLPEHTKSESPRAMESAIKDIHFFKFILHSYELTDEKKVAILKVLV